MLNPCARFAFMRLDFLSAIRSVATRGEGSLVVPEESVEPA